MKDLPAIDIGGIRDVYARFEASLPFNRTLVTVLLKKIDEAEKECGDQGFVTLAALRTQLPTPSWKPLESPDSMLGKVLLSDSFKDAKQNQSPDQIDVTFLKCFALIHCSGKPIDKTNAFYEVLQEGGFERHTQISAGDKDFAPVFDKMCSFVTKDVFDLAKMTGSVENHVYTEDEMSQIAHKDVFEVIREEVWLEEVFGAQSRLENDIWVDKVSKVANWIFDAATIRKKIFNEAKVTMRH